MAKSRVAITKEKMEWKKTGPMCKNCIFFSSKTEETETPFGVHKKVVEKRCRRGDFATGLSCWCAEHEFK